MLKIKGSFFGRRNILALGPVNQSLLVAVILLFFLVPRDLPAAEKEVELLTDAEFLQPTSTFELRFVDPVVAKDSVGTIAPDPPLVIEPAIPGTFTWLSQRSGVFVPSAAPPLGTELELTIRPGFQDLSGKVIGQNFRVRVKTPPYAITAVIAPDREELSPKPEIRLALNLDTELDPSRFVFVSGGAKVPAEVRYATAQDYFQVAPEDLDWNRRWARGEHSRITPVSDEDETEPQMDRLIVTPGEPLTGEQEWRLEIAPGLKSITGNREIIQAKTVSIGVIPPFAVKRLEAANYIHSGKSIRLEFSRDLAGDITSGLAAQFFKVEPAVGHLRYEIDGSDVVIWGDFVLGEAYQVSIGPDVVDSYGSELTGEHTLRVKFSPVKPRIYLPIVSGDQFRNGARQFEVLSINVRQLHVRARLVDPDAAPAAKKAFAGYNQSDEATDDNEPNHRLAEDKIGGKLIYDRVVDLTTTTVDTQLRTELPWNEIIGPGRGGMILLTIEGDPIADAGQLRVGAQALIQLTDIGVLWAREREQLRFSVFSLSTGQPIPNAQVRLLDSDLKLVPEVSDGVDNVTTNPRGHEKLVTDGNGSVTARFFPEIGWAEIKLPNDAYTLQLGSNTSALPTAGFNLDINYPAWERQPEELNGRCFVFTDRPLYRPGEIVHVKGMVRSLTSSGLAPADGWKGQATLTNAQGESVYSGEIVTKPDGEFETDIRLNQSSVGRHQFRITFGNGDQIAIDSYAGFEVANYEPNAFELDLVMPERLGPDIAPRAEVTAKYLFGAPLTKAKVHWTLQSAPTIFYPDNFEGYQFTPEEEQPKTTTVGGSDDYDGVHPLILDLTMPAVTGRPVQGVLTVEMTDINQQTVTESRVFQKDPSAFYLGITVPDTIVVRAGSKVPVQCIAVTPEGKPLERAVDVKVELIRKRSETVRVKSAGKAVSFRTNAVEEKIGEWEGQSLQPVLVSGKWTTPQDNTAEVMLPAAGEYVVRACARDADGHAVLTDYSLYVAGDEAVSWDYRNAAQIDLVPDKIEYHPGDTARVLVKSPFTGEAIVDIERGTDILRSRRVQLQGNAPELEIPIIASDAPNVYVSVVLVRGADASTRKVKAPEFRYGIAMLRVSDPATKLQIAMTPTKPSFEPGEPIEVNLLVKDGLGRPVPNSGLTFFAVDDGVLALTGYQPPDPYKGFFSTFPLNVQIGMTLDSLLAEDPQDLRFTNKGYLIGGGGLDIPGAKLRTNFPGTACWLPDLHTDASGQAKVKFTAPDAVTRYRLVAVAAAGNQFGSGESAVMIRKPLLLMPSMAQFVRTGDRLIARAVIRNDTDHTENVRVRLQLDGRISSSEPTETALTLESGKAQTVDFPLSAGSPGTSHWQWSAESQDHSDGVAAATEVESAGPVLNETYLSDLNGKQANLLATVNPQLLEGSGVVNVTLSNTRLTSLREAVVALRTYPYECSEQLTSGLVPWLTATQLKAALPTLLANDTTQQDKVANTLSILFARQTESGGLALWPGSDEPSLFASAYAAWVMAGLQRQGVEVPAEKWKQLLGYLSSSLRGLPKIQDELRLQELAFAALALATAGKPEPAYQEALFQRSSELSHETRAIVALAMLSNPDAGRDAVATLLDPRTGAPDAVSFYGGTARGDALQLLAWTRYKPRSPEVGILVKELLHMRHGGSWNTTQENAWALLALASYYQTTESGGKSVEGLFVTATQSLPFTVNRQTPSWSTSLTLDPANPIKELLVQNGGTGVLFSDMHFEVYPVVTAQPRQDRGYAIFRTYQKVDEDGNLAPAVSLKIGDRIVVTINVKSNRAGRLVAIDDPIPSIFEALNPTFRPENMDLSPEQDFVDYRQIKGDRVVFFRNQLPAGDYTFTYLSRVRFQGEAIAPGTKVVEMYRPDRFGLSESAKVTANER